MGLVGPMRAAKIFVEDLEYHGILSQVEQLRVDLYGSLALTGKGHNTPEAVLMGLEGESPESVNTRLIVPRVKHIETAHELLLRQSKKITFVPSKHLIFHYRENLPQHPNGMRFSAFNREGDLLATNEYFSIGGGFVVNEATRINKDENVYYKDQRVDHVSEMHISEFHLENIKIDEKESIKQVELERDQHTEMPHAEEGISSNIHTTSPPLATPALVKTEPTSLAAALPFYNASSLLRVCEMENLSIAQVVFKNELQWRSADDIKARTMNIWHVMNESIENGIQSSDEYLPGPLKVKRRAPGLYRKLLKGLAEYAGMNAAPSFHYSSPSSRHMQSAKSSSSVSQWTEPSFTKYQPKVYKRSLPALDWISLYAIAVNEENAAGGRVVTAPTNGAAGVIPAVIKYYLDFICPSPSHFENDTVEMLLTAAAIGMLYKRGASISAAEMGCQGEVGVACSMAAAAFTAVMGGTPEQVENAAEIAMEHNLGLTCDPIAGLVQIPCIERNALGAVKAITAAQLSLNGDGAHRFVKARRDVTARVSLDQVIETMRQTGIDMQSKYKETSQGGLAVNVPVC